MSIRPKICHHNHCWWTSARGKAWMTDVQQHFHFQRLKNETKNANVFLFVLSFMWRTLHICQLNPKNHQRYLILVKTFIRITQGHKSHQLNNHLNTKMMFLRMSTMDGPNALRFYYFSDCFAAISSYFQAMLFVCLFYFYACARIFGISLFHCNSLFAERVFSLSANTQPSRFAVGCWQSLANAETQNSKPNPFQMRMKYVMERTECWNAYVILKNQHKSAPEKQRTKYYNRPISDILPIRQWLI